MANQLDQLQSLPGQQGVLSTGESSKGNAPLPGATGGLVGLLVTSKSPRKLLTRYGTSALLAGGGAMAGTVLWNKYQQKTRAQNVPAPEVNTSAVVPVDVDPRSVRLIAAPIFAIRGDGYIDNHERANIEAQLRAVNINVQAQVLTDQALAQPLDPQHPAESIVGPQKALEIYYVSCVVVDIDHFMECSYLNVPGDALSLLKDVRINIKQDIQSQRQALSV